MPADSPRLPRAPASALGPTGAPRFGAYAGSLGAADLSPLSPPGLLAGLRHAALTRRWQSVVLAGRDHVVALDVIEGGLLAGGSIWVAERRSGELLFDRAGAGLPGLSATVGARPGAGARASFVGPGIALAIERRSDRYQLEADVGDGLRLEARLDAGGGPEPFSLVAPLPGAGVRAAQAAGPLPVDGLLTVRGREVPLGGALATIEFGAGIFPREISWRKLTAAGRSGGRAVALHLVDGLPGPAPEDGGEGVLLVDPGPVLLPAVAFEVDPASTSSPWRIASEDGRVELIFRPGAIHREARTLLLLSTRRVQLAGELSGHLPGPGGERLHVADLAARAEETWSRG